MLCPREMQVQRVLAAKAGRQAAVMTAFDSSSSATEQLLCHLLSLHTRDGLPGPPPTLFIFLSVLWSLQREGMHGEWEADGKGMGRECSPSLSGSQDLTAGTGELQFMPSLHRELCWPGHRLKTD